MTLVSVALLRLLICSASAHSCISIRRTHQMWIPIVWAYLLKTGSKSVIRLSQSLRAYGLTGSSMNQIQLADMPTIQTAVFRQSFASRGKPHQILSYLRRYPRLIKPRKLISFMSPTCLPVMARSAILTLTLKRVTALMSAQTLAIRIRAARSRHS